MAEGGQAGNALAVPGGAGVSLERVGALAGDLRGRWAGMSGARRRWMATSALLIAAVIAALVWYAGRTEWRVLFSGLDAKDTEQIAQELSAAGITARMSEDGSGIEVGADQVDRARMEVATKGMPQSGRMGFELFDKPNWVGSEFDEKVNYQRALEGELEHTIGTLAVVGSARVHLVLPKDELFGEREPAAKASVVLELRRASLPPEQVEAIRSLVAGAVENLDPQNVTLVDADGRLNLVAPSQGAAAGDAERGMEERLVAMLEPTAGAGNVRATVNVVYDESSQEKTDEVVDPTQVAALSLHKSQQTLGSKPRAAGVPGTASNTPGAAAPGSVQAAAKPVPPLLQTANGAGAANPQKDAAGLPVYPENGAEGETMTEETGSYAVTRHLLHSEEGPGRVKRVTAAVVVNDRMETEGAGKAAHTVWKPRSAEEMQRLEQLAQAAVGFDRTRGDQVVIENVSFSSNAPEPAPVGMAKVMDETDAVLDAQPGLLKTVCGCAVGLLLVLTVVRPLARHMMTALKEAPALALPAPAPQGAGRVAGGRVFGQPAGAGGTGFVLPKRPSDTQGMYEQISDQIRREPAQSTRVLESWINAPAEEED